MTCSSGVDAIVISQLLFPKGLVCTTLVIPAVTSPSLIPHPVAIQLLQTLTVRQLVCRIGPVPIRGLRIEVKPLRMVYAVHGLNGLLNEGRRRPSPGFEISQNVYVVDMYRCCVGQLPMGLAPRTTRLVGGQRLTCVFRHGVDVGVEGQ